MNKPKILITGATGKTGSAVVTQLRERGYPVRAVVHSIDARSQRLAGLGAEIAVADLFDFEQLSAAMHGVQRAYYCPPYHPYMIHSAASFAIAARGANLESVVVLSQWLASPSHPALATRHHWLIDRLFAMIPDIALTIVNPGFFADVYTMLLPNAALTGVFPLPVEGASRNAPPSNEDIARVAVGALIDPEKHAGKVYRPTGPELLSVNEMVAIFSRVLERTVRHVPVPMWMFIKGARVIGQSPHTLSALPHYLREHSNGAFAFGAPTNHVFEVSGQHPESFETITRRYAALPESRQTFSNKVKAFTTMMSLPLRPGLNAQRFEAEHDFPTPPVPRFDLESERWKMEHTSADAAASAFLKSVRP